MAVFVTIGVELFSEGAPKEFGTFFRGFYTLFGVIAYGTSVYVASWCLPRVLVLASCLGACLVSWCLPRVLVLASRLGAYPGLTGRAHERD